MNALAHLRRLEGELMNAGEKLKISPLQVSEGVDRALAQQKQLKKELDQLKQQLLSGGAADVTSKAKDMGDFRVLGALVELADQDAIRQYVDQLRDKLAPSVILVGTKAQKGKVSLVCSVSKELTKRFQAGAIVKECAQLVGGSGGGRPDFAQAGGTDADKLEEAVNRVYEIVAR
jgi:alanyl-tRNA synthetase